MDKAKEKVLGSLACINCSYVSDNDDEINVHCYLEICPECNTPSLISFDQALNYFFMNYLKSDDGFSPEEEQYKELNFED